MSPSGHIVTAFHVVDGGGLAQVRFPDGEWQDAKLLSHSAVCDIAVLKIGSPTPDFLSIAREPAIKIGDTVFTIGYPLIREYVSPMEPRVTAKAELIASVQRATCLVRQRK